MREKRRRRAGFRVARGFRYGLRAGILLSCTATVQPTDRRLHDGCSAASQRPGADASPRSSAPSTGLSLTPAPRRRNESADARGY